MSKQDKTAIIEKVFREALAYARDLNHEFLTLEHVTLVLLDDAEIQSICQKNNISVGQIKADIEGFLQSYDAIRAQHQLETNPRKTDAIERVAQRGVALLMFNPDKAAITPVDMLSSVLQEEECYARYYCEVNGLTEDLFRREVKQAEETEANRELLEEFTVNLNEEAKNSKIDPLIGRVHEVDDLVHILARRKKNNCVLVGEPGTGKTAIAEGLAKKIVDGEVPAILKNKVVYNMDIAGMLAGTKYRGEFEERIKGVLKILEADPNAILFIDEIHMIIGAGASGQGNVDAANILKPVLGRGRLLTIGATTPDEFADTFEKDRALSRRFAKLDIQETDLESTKEIVLGLRHHYEVFHNVEYDVDLLLKAVDLTDRYVKTKHFPDKALDIVDAAGAAVKLRGDKEVTMKDIVKVISKISKIGEDVIDTDSVNAYVTLDTRIKNTVFGQDEAINKMVEAILVSKSGLKEPNKPIGSFLFVGPTGTGKTETARSLAKELQAKLVKFDMSEFQERHSVAKLIGAPPGYVGHAEGKMGQGQLLAAVEESPNCVLLLDEVEKAAPQVLNVLLQIMDDGKLTGSAGKTVDFTNVVLLMTSNLGAAEAEKRKIGFGDQANDSKVTEAIEKFFTPEFRNRIDAVVKFNKLGHEQMLLIVDRLVKDTNDLLYSNSSTVRIAVSDEAKEQLAKDGYQPSMGARPLKRVFDEHVKKPLSKKILFEDLDSCVITVEYSEEDGYTFKNNN